MNKTLFLPINFEFQSTLLIIRDYIVGRCFDIASKIYVKLKRGDAWDISMQEMLRLPQESLGFHLGSFLLKHNFKPHSKGEDHDVFHVLTEYQTDTADEIAMQFYLHGNGKRSTSLNLAIACGLLLYMDKYSYFFAAHHRGSTTLPLHNIDYSKILNMPLTKIKTLFEIHEL